MAHSFPNTRTEQIDGHVLLDRPKTEEINNFTDGMVNGGDSETKDDKQEKAKDKSDDEEDESSDDSEYVMNILHVMFPLFGMLYH